MKICNAESTGGARKNNAAALISFTYALQQPHSHLLFEPCLFYNPSRVAATLNRKNKQSNPGRAFLLARHKCSLFLLCRVIALGLIQLQLIRSLAIWLRIFVPARTFEANRMQVYRNEKSCVPLTQLYADLKSDLASFN
jgi:hypothetical protein